MKSDNHNLAEREKPSILVADDEDAFRELLCEALTEWGYHVTPASNGDEAIAVLEREPVDFALVDVRMPGANGESVLRLVRERSLNVSVIMITGFGSIEDAVKFMRLGAVDYLTKPLILEELRFKVRRVFEERRARMLSITDSKTGLFNHYYLMERLEEEMTRARRYTRPLSVLMIDVDHFKDYNDLCGHLAGDEALRQVGGVCEEISRESDITARFGGEEFVMLLTETDLASAAIVAERVRAAVEICEITGAEKLSSGRLTVSIGVAQLDVGAEDTPETSASLVNRADQALYAAKRAGRNRVAS